MAPLPLAHLTSGRMQGLQFRHSACPAGLLATCSSTRLIAPGHGGRHAVRALGRPKPQQRDALRCSCTATESETTTTSSPSPPTPPSSSNPPPTTSDPAVVPRIKRTMAGLDSLLGIQEDEKDKAKDSAAAASSSSTPHQASSTDLDPESQRLNLPKKPAGATGTPEMEDHIQKIIDKARKLADEQSTKGPSTSSELEQAALKREFESFLETLAKPQTLSKDDIKALKDAAFGPLTFWVTETLPIQEESRTGLLIRGNLRDERDKVFRNLCAKVAELFKGKYEVLMVEDTEAEDDGAARSMPGAPSLSAGTSRGLITGPRVAFQIVPAAQAQPPQTDTLQRAAAFILALLVIVSTLELALTSNISSLPKDVLEYFSNPNNLNGDQVPAAVENWDPSAYIAAALPIAGALLGVNLAHETGHRVAAVIKGVQLGPSFFIPFGEIGSLGAITPFTSLLKNRAQLWDVAAAGPLAGAVVASGLLLLGLAQSAGLDPADSATAATFVTVPTQLFQGSLLLGGVARAILGEQALRGSVVLVSPFVIAGWCGLITTALNMLPVGSLDGGRMVQATYGRKALDLTGFFTYLGLGLGLLGSSLALPFGLYVIITQRTCEKYIQDNVSPTGNARMTATAVAVLTAVMVLVPMAPELADAFGVGSVNQMLL